MAEATVIRQLARLIDYDASKVPLDAMNAVLGWIDKIDLGQPLEPVPAQNFADRFKEIQVALLDDLPKWRALVRELIALEYQ